MIAPSQDQGFHLLCCHVLMPGRGAVQRAAVTQSALAKERRELREQQQRAASEAVPKDLSRLWEDPLPELGERHLAQVCVSTILI